MPSNATIAPRRVTSSDVAREAGVSRATVGFVLNRTPGQTISAETQERVTSAAARLGYRPNESARRLARGSTRIVLMVLPDWPLEHSMQRNIDAATAMLERAGYTLVTFTPHGSAARPLWETLSPDVVIGMTPFTDEQIQSMRTSGVLHIVPDVGAKEAPDSHPAYNRGPRLQVKHLHALGHRRIGFAATADARLQGLQATRLNEAVVAAAELGIEIGPVETIAVDAHAALAAWREAGCTAVSAYNDEVAAVVVRTALSEGLTVPGDLAVIGHDGSPLAKLFYPALSTIEVDYEALGRYSAQIALAAIGDMPEPSEPDQVLTLVARDSTVPVTDA